MPEKTIPVLLNEKQLEFMIGRTHEDSKFRAYLKEHLEQLKREGDDE